MHIDTSPKFRSEIDLRRKVIVEVYIQIYIEYEPRPAAMRKTFIIKISPFKHLFFYF